MESQSTKEGEFGLGFNDIDFSDRVLHLEITPDFPSNKSDDSGDTDFEVKKLYVCSLMLAAKSPYFYKLFKIDMKESKQKDEVTLRIKASEEAAFMDLLKLMYGIPMDASSAPELVDVLMAAEKFAVPSCGKHCIELLLKLPMTTEDAVFYLDLPLSVLEYEQVHTLHNTAQEYITAHFRNLTESLEEAMNLPLSAIQIVLGIDRLQVDSEDDLFDFILKWSRLHYPEWKERREILVEHLMDHICLANMSSLKLMEVVDCAVFCSAQGLNLLLGALKSKDQVLTETKYDIPREVNKYKLSKVVQIQLSQPSCLVYFDLTKEECAAAADLIPSKPLYSEKFSVGGQTFELYTLALWKLGTRALGLYIRRTVADFETCSLDFTFEVMKKSSKQFHCLVKSNNCILQGKRGIGIRDPFEVPWVHFMSDSSDYFIDGILHLRARITIVD